MNLTEKEYLEAKDLHDCTMDYKGYCRTCEELYLYERQFINDKQAEVIGEML